MTRALRRVRSVTSRRQLRWIVWGTALGALPFVFGYAMPFAFGFEPVPGAELTAILLALVPLAFASAIIRYRLMDVEVIIKRALGLRRRAGRHGGDLRRAAEAGERACLRRRPGPESRSSRCWRRSSSRCCCVRSRASSSRHSTACITAIGTTIAGRSWASHAT